MSDSPGTTRREFVRAAGAAAAGMAAFPSRPASLRPLGANERLHVAVIGCGLRAQAHFKALENRIKRLDDIRVIAVCDLYEKRLQAAVRKTKAKGYRDYQEVLALKDLQALFAPIPWHWHAKICLDACEAGKDIYIETPIANSIEDARKVYEAVQRTGRVLEVGNQPLTDDKYQQAKKVVASGILGKVVIATTSYARNTKEGQWNSYPIDREAGPDDVQWPVWQGLRWGLAPERPFTPERYFRWRKFRDYGGGAASDLLCHGMGCLFVALGFEFARQATSAGGQFVEMDRDVFDTYLSMVEFPSGYVCVLDGTMVNEQGGGETIRGHEATCFIDDDGVVVVPEPPFENEFMERCEAAGLKGEWIQYPTRKRGREFQTKSLKIPKKESDLPATDLLHDDFLRCVRTRGKPLEGAWEGYTITVAVEMGVQSYFQNRTMYFDVEKQRLLDTVPPRPNQKKF